MNLPSSHIPNRRSSSITSLTPVRDLLCTPPGKKPAIAVVVPNKSKRVRTGCLTCRERHLKCDEALPDCLNCRKSNRQCKRGVRLNFIDIQVKKPPCLLPPAAEWSVQFQDESRQIASEYVGGLGRYAHLPREPETPARPRAHVEPNPHRHQQQHDMATLPQPTQSNIADPSLGAPQSRFPPMLPISTSALYGFSNSRLFPTDLRLPSELPQPRTSAEVSFTAPQISSQPALYPFHLQDHFAAMRDKTVRSHAHRNSDSSSAASIAPLVTGPPPSFRGAVQGQVAPDGMMTPPPSEKAAAGEREYLNSADEIHYMQVFVEEVGVWMDSLDKDKHFSRLIPYQSLKSPMLLNAFLACGVKHLTLTNPDWQDDKALYYYDTATTQLLRSLQNPDRNTAECATTAVVLNVYEIMSERPGQHIRMNHIAGARALIRECGWNARSSGIGAACFWLNIGMEVLSCLAFNWQTSWDPDHWGLDMDFATSDKREADSSATAAGGLGQEEEWVHRIFYIVAKIANFRATIPKFQEASAHDEQMRLGSRLAQWHDLKRLCDKWNNACPRTMHPFGYLYPSQSKSKSAFPNVWLIKRAAIIGRLIYHTAQCLLAQTNPMEPGKASEEMRVLQLHHAHQVCGIVAHSNDRGVASVAIRSIAIASAVLTNPREQEEVLEILDRIHRESGWHLGGVTAELRRNWGWTTSDPTTFYSSGLSSSMGTSATTSSVMGDASSLARRFYETSGQSSMPSGLNPGVGMSNLATSMSQQQQPSSSQAQPSKVNPLSFADFSLPNHPYQNWYEPPNRTNSYAAQNFL